MPDSLLSLGTQGVNNGLTIARNAAADIASVATSSPGTPVGAEPPTSPEAPESLSDLTSAAVELKVGELQVKASAAVIKTADEVLGTIINTVA